MRVKLTHHVAYNAGTFRERFVRPITTVIHGIQNSAMDWLKSVSHIGQGPADNNAHCIVQIGPLHFYLKINLVYPIGLGAVAYFV
jgi:hypothetical protein